MKLPARIAVWMLPLLVTGCFHRKHQAPQPPLAPPIVEPQPAAPAPEPQPTASAPQPAAPEHPAEQPAATAPKPQASEAPRPTVRRAPKKSNSHPQVASNGSPGVSAIGQLSSGDSGSSYRRQTEESLATTERGLKALNSRTLNDQQQRTLAHIREFLKQARQALASGDVDGAHTLAAKAHVLLNELTR